LLTGLVGRFGPFIDELYYVSYAHRLDWGYVDHPPFSVALLRVFLGALGNGMLALRLPAALTGAAVVFITGLLARKFGAGGAGQALACGSVLSAPGMNLFFGYYSMNAFEILIWLACCWVFLRALDASPPLAPARASRLRD
jgi:4-amino-4-deoxy-L-arabinose transferase-like glycosyltransferase